MHSSFADCRVNQLRHYAMCRFRRCFLRFYFVSALLNSSSRCRFFSPKSILKEMNLDDKINFFSKIKDREDAKKFILDLAANLRAAKRNEFDFKKFEEGILLLNANMPMNLIGLRMFY